MRNLNLCQFIGRIGKDIDLRYTPSGDAVANFSIACGDDYKDKQGNKVEQTEWINLVAFGKLAEIIGQYCKKGSKIYCSGNMKTRKWQDQSGNNRYTTEVRINQMEMLDSKGDGQQSSGAPNVNQAAQEEAAFDDDPIPF